jgi:hypothetical protein
MMVRLFVPFPSLAFTPHRDRCPIIAVNDAGDAEKRERVDLLFLFLNSVISPIFWGVATLVPAERIGACPHLPNLNSYSGPSFLTR